MLETIEGLFEAELVTRGNGASWRGVTPHGFFQRSIEKCSFDVQVGDVNALSAAVRDKEAQGGIFGHGGVVLFYTYAISLEETTDHNPGLIAQGLPIFTGFEFEHPFDREALGVGWERTRLK